jgi:hypothetical protein
MVERCGTVADARLSTCRFGKGGQPLSIILREVNKLPARIQNTYLSQSNYWLTWLPLRLWAAVFDLAQIINLILVWAKARLFGRTPREIREWTKPPKFDYAVYVSQLFTLKRRDSG